MPAKAATELARLEARAVAAVIAHDRAGALKAYEALHMLAPDNPTFATMHKALADELAAQEHP